jgi:hypothetical protein
MSSFGAWLATSPLASWFKVFVSAVLGAWLADLAGVASVEFSNWEAWVTAGIIAVLPVVINWLNGSDTRYGRASGG